MKINTNFKDSVFTKLFSEPDLLRELYCALEGTTLPSDLSVSINTLENVVFMDLYNDISFEIGGKLVVLIEHQSTINPNMGLRLLLYISRVLEKIITGKNLYSGNRLSIPWPEFFVLYNGKEPYPDNATLRLSDLFEKPHDLGLPKKAVPLLDLEVKVININEGKNEAIVSRCKKLAEYSAFIAKTRSFEKDLQDREKAVKAAIKYCSRYDILKEFLEIHASEVLNMLLTEWNTEDALSVRFEEGMERGFEEGVEKGMVRGIEKGVEKTLDLIAQGYSIDEIRERLTYKTAGREDKKTP
ncbi:MAG: Rpn family recombination-promoting nuclease/putative transposase [Treponema sp.]|nr:Rpn family recombination-promoting nuclease/putative transposase [Treponema sp.]